MGEAMEHLNERMQQLQIPVTAVQAPAAQQQNSSPPHNQQQQQPEQNQANQATRMETSAESNEITCQQVAKRIADSWTGMLKNYGWVQGWNEHETLYEAKLTFYRESHYWASTETLIEAAKIIEQRLQITSYWKHYEARSRRYRLQ